MKLSIREPINSITHLIGIILSAFGLIFLLIPAINSGSVMKIISAVVFSIGLIGLYTASTVYHWKIASVKKLKIFRKIDHIMIYVLIAATYTPVCLITLRGTIGYVLLSVVWSLAILGAILKIVWLDAPRWLSTVFYLCLGWTAIFVIYPIYKVLPTEGLMLLVGGGIAYSIGAVIYGLKSQKIRIWKFGFHEIFHLFILLGSFIHYIMVLKYIVCM